MFEVTAFYCPDGRKYEWATPNERAAELLRDALRGLKDWVDVKIVEYVQAGAGRA